MAFHVSIYRESVILWGDTQAQSRIPKNSYLEESVPRTSPGPTQVCKGPPLCEARADARERERPEARPAGRRRTQRRAVKRRARPPEPGWAREYSRLCRVSPGPAQTPLHRGGFRGRGGATAEHNATSSGCLRGKKHPPLAFNSDYS